jgi:hypothetical protein
MTNTRQADRIRKQYTDNRVQSIRTFAEAIVKEVYDNNIVRVMVLPEKTLCFARVSFDLAENGSNTGKMPIVESRVLIAFLSQVEDPYEDVVILRQLFDSKNLNPARESNGSNDINYYTITPTNGGKIDFYKDNSNKETILIKGKENGIIKVESNEIKLGIKDSNNDNPNPLKDDYDFEGFVKYSHLVNYYNKFVSVVKGFLQDLGTATLIGDLGIPMLVGVRVANYVQLLTDANPFDPDNTCVATLTPDTEHYTRDVKGI